MGPGMVVSLRVARQLVEGGRLVGVEWREGRGGGTAGLSCALCWMWGDGVCVCAR